MVFVWTIEASDGARHNVVARNLGGALGAVREAFPTGFEDCNLTSIERTGVVLNVHPRARADCLAAVFSDRPLSEESS